MRTIRRSLQVVTFIGTFVIGVLALALIVSQTSWFRDWLRRYIVRESRQYLNGQLTIGSLQGNLLFGATLADLAVDVPGERILTVKGIELDYSVFTILSRGLTLEQITIDRPVLHVERDRDGWNVARLLKSQEQAVDRQGPTRPVSLPSIDISDASVAIKSGDVAGVSLPRRIDDLDVRARFEYAPVHYSLTLDQVSFLGRSPSISLRELTGRIDLHDDNLYVEDVRLVSAETSVTLTGVIEQYLVKPVVKLTATGKVSLPEIGRVVPAAAGYDLHPVVDLEAEGPADRLGLALKVRSEAGNIRGQLTADVQAPGFSAHGDLDVESLNLAPILQDPAQATNLTGHVNVDLAMTSSPETVPTADGIGGSFVFNGPRVVAAGYEAHDVSVSGSIAESRISFEGRAAAYGATATTRGFIVTPGPGRPLSFDLRGALDDVNLRDLPASVGAPRLLTNLSVTEYHIAGDDDGIGGTAVLSESAIEGAAIAAGTTAAFALVPESISYSARGEVADLDLDRIGRALDVEALATPAFDSRINGWFDASGRAPRAASRAQPGSQPAPSSAISTMKLDVTGALNDSAVMGGRLPELAFEVHLDRGALAGRVKGGFEGFNPGQLANRKELDGAVAGIVAADFSIRDVSAPIAADAITAEGRAALTSSTIGGLTIDSAEVEGKYTEGVGDLTKLGINGPDLKVDASGRISLDRHTSSNLGYHVAVTNLPAVAKLGGQSAIGGTATLDGTLTGNAAVLTTAGTLRGSELSDGANTALGLTSQYTVTVPDLRFANARVQATTEATFVKAGGMELDSMKATTTYNEKTLDFTTSLQEKSRELDASGQVLFHPDHQEIHLPALAVRAQGVEWRSAPGGQATVKYASERVDFENLRLVNADQSLEVSGALAIGAGRPSGAIEVKASNVDLAQLDALTLQKPGLSGRLNADVTISGTTSAPEVTGVVDISDGGFERYHYDSLTARVDYQGARVGVDATLHQSAIESLTVNGSVPTGAFTASHKRTHVEPAPDEAIDLQITTTAINLAIVQSLTNQVINATGTLQADVHITGSADDPHALGFIDINNGGFSLPAAGETFTGLATRIELTPEAVKIREFELRDRHGEKLRIAGQIAVHPRQADDVHVAIESDNFEVLNNELGDVQVQTALELTGDLSRLQLVGEVRLDAARIEADKVLSLFYTPYAEQSMGEVVPAERTVEASGGAEDATRQALAKAAESAAPPETEEKPGEDQQEAQEASGALAPLSMDVQVVARDNLVVRANDLRAGGPTAAALGDLNVTLGGDLHVRKRANGPIILAGLVNTVRGTYDFQGRRFDLVRDGTIRFPGTADINPLLDISATRRIPNTGVEARIHITGTANAPQLSLTSDPPLEESDILALIVFNRPVNELGTGERSSLAATAGGIATGFVAAPLGQSIGKALDLDLFEISPTTETGDLGASITVGQQLNERTFIRLFQQFGQQTTTEFRVEYQLMRFLRLEASVAPETSGSANRINQRRIEKQGVDLIFFFGY